jgi:hypothetical protein
MMAMKKITTLFTLALVPGLMLAQPGAARGDAGAAVAVPAARLALAEAAPAQTRVLLFDVDEARSALARAFARQRQGRLGFSLRGPGVDRDIAASCALRARRAPDGAAEATAPAAIACRFHEAGRWLPAYLELKQRSGQGGSHTGRLRFDGIELAIASAPEGAAPGAYVFAHQGVAVGAVELGARPLVRFSAAHGHARARRAVMLAATALGVLWGASETSAATLAAAPAQR